MGRRPRRPRQVRIESKVNIPCDGNLYYDFVDGGRVISWIIVKKKKHVVIWKGTEQDVVDYAEKHGLLPIRQS